MRAADRVEILVVVDNWVDMLLPDQESDGLHCVRNGLVEHFDPRRVPPQAENGISLLVRAWHGRHAATVLFDLGLTGAVLEHNLWALGADPAALDHVVISHGHPDHYGGIYRLLADVQRSMPVALGADAFLPRYAVTGDGRTSTYYNQSLTADGIERAGGRLVAANDPLDLGCGAFTTGAIPRVTGFERPRPPAQPGGPGLYQVRANGDNVLDEVLDEQALVIDVAGHGLVVLTGCAHAGVVNTVRRARELTGNRPVRAVIGGFHLGFPTTPTENVRLTADALQELEVRTIVPMHCSGLRAHAEFGRAAPGRYLQPAVGTLLRFGR